jgi:hypothetical protein
MELLYTHLNNQSTTISKSLKTNLANITKLHLLLPYLFFEI